MLQAPNESLHDVIEGMDMSTYKVQAGDTLGRIAKKFYGDASRFSVIVAANSIRNPDKLKVGQELVIPDAAASVMPVAVSAAPVVINSGISGPAPTPLGPSERWSMDLCMIP